MRNKFIYSKLNSGMLSLEVAQNPTTVCLHVRGHKRGPGVDASDKTRHYKSNPAVCTLASRGPGGEGSCAD